MELSAYELALIADGFTLAGAFIAALVAYWLTVKVEKSREHRAACGKLRAAFAPALATIYLGRHHGNHDRPAVGNIFKDSLLVHASAIEAFRPFATNCGTYQQSWEDFRKTVREDNFVIDTLEWETNLELWATLELKIHAILKHAET
ncbi:MAG TPA: hypothetical protein VIM34_08855 [Burkholderiaceae bacterium]